MLSKTERLEKALKRARLRLSGREPGAKPAFVFGAQRSGTDMVMSVFNRCPSAECYLESDPEAFVAFVLRSKETTKSLTQKSRADTVFFKCIANSQNARTLLHLDRNAKAIWLFRPYADVVNSSLKRFRRHFLELAQILHDPKGAGWKAQNVTSENMALVRKFHDKDVSDASARAFLWFLRNQLLFQQRLETDPRVIISNYDHIVSEPVEAFARIFKFFDLPFNPKYVRRVQVGSIAKEPAPKIDPEIAQLCDEMFNRLSGVASL